MLLTIKYFNMKKLVYVLIFTALTAIGGCGKMQEETHKRAITENQNQDIFNNFTESISPNCEFAQTVIKDKSAANILKEDEISVNYECQRDANTFNNTNGKVLSRTQLFLTILTLVLTGIVLIVTYFEYTAVKMAQNVRRQKNFVVMFLLQLFMGVLVSFFFYIALTVFGYGYEFSTTQGNAIDAASRFRERSESLPNADGKEDRLIGLLEYAICVKSSNFENSNQDSSIRINKSSIGYSIHGLFERCDLAGGVAVDNKGIMISEKYKVGGDYEKLQEQAIINAFRNYLLKADQIATRYVAGDANNFFNGKFKPEEMNCSMSSLLSVKTPDLDKRDLEKYKVYANKCLTDDFIFELNKTPGMTKEALDEHIEETGNKTISICDGTFNTTKVPVKREEIVEQYKACVDRNCTAAASPYACGTALNKYFSTVDDKYSTLFTLPRSDSRRRLVDNSSAEKVSNSINTQFSFLKEEQFRASSNSISTINIVKKPGRMSFKDIEKAFDIGDKSILEKVASVLSFDNVMNNFHSDDGAFSSGRYLLCIQYPNSTQGRFDCGNTYEETQRFGYTLSASGFFLKLGLSMYTAPVKRIKPSSADFSYAATEKALSAFIPKANVKRVLATYLPFVTDGVGVIAGDDIYNSNFHSVTGQKLEYYALMALVAMNENASQIVGWVSNVLTASGQFFVYVLPLNDYFMWLTMLTVLIYQLLFAPMTISIHHISRAFTPQEKKHIDRPEAVLWLETLIFTPINIVTCFKIYPLIVMILIKFAFGDLNEFSASLIKWESGLGIPLLIMLFSLLLIVTLFIAVSKLPTIMIKQFSSAVHGEASKHDVFAQEVHDMQAMAKSYKGKILQ